VRQDNTREEQERLYCELKKTEEEIRAFEGVLDQSKKRKIIVCSFFASNLLATGYFVLSDFNISSPVSISIKGLGAVSIITWYALNTNGKAKKLWKEKTVRSKIHLTYINLPLLLAPVCSLYAINRGASIMSSLLVLISTNNMCLNALTIRNINELEKEKQEIINRKKEDKKRILESLGIDQEKQKIKN